MKFVTAINCMDGRTQLPVSEHLKSRYGATYVDTITEPGVDRVVAEEPEDSPVIEALKRKCNISIEHHNSDLIAVVGHHGCAGNPVEKETHLEHIKKAVERLKGWYPDLKVIGIWVDEEWRANEI